MVHDKVVLRPDIVIVGWVYTVLLAACPTHCGSLWPCDCGNSDTLVQTLYLSGWEKHCPAKVLQKWKCCFQDQLKLPNLSFWGWPFLLLILKHHRKDTSGWGQYFDKKNVTISRCGGANTPWYVKCTPFELFIGQSDQCNILKELPQTFSNHQDIVHQLCFYTHWRQSNWVQKKKIQKCHWIHLGHLVCTF